jgi:hypothetical protein
MAMREARGERERIIAALASLWREPRAHHAALFAMAALAAAGKKKRPATRASKMDGWPSNAG